MSKIFRLTLSLSFSLLLFVNSALAGDIYVDGQNATGTVDGSAAFPYLTIQAAVDNAVAGDTVIVKPGLYLEKVVIRQSIALISETIGAATIRNNIVDGLRNPASVMVVAENVTVRGFRLEQRSVSTNAGIAVHRDNCIITDNISSGNFIGISLRVSSNSTVENNIINNCKYGIQILRGGQNLLTGNDITQGKIAVVLGAIGGGYGNPDVAVDNILVDNNVFQSDYALYFARSSTNNTIYHNNFIEIKSPEKYHPSSVTLMQVKDFATAGNYWSNWTAPDVNGDGIIDTPYGFDLYPVADEDGWENLLLDYSVFNQRSGLDYYSINQAIQEAFAGDTIVVSAGDATGFGIYYEHVVVDKPLNLVSTAGRATIKNGVEWEDVRADIEIEANDVTVSGFHLKRGHFRGNDGIAIFGQNCLVKDNLVDGTNSGIWVTGSNNTVEDNEIRNCNYKYGLLIQGEQHLIQRNEVSDSTIGVHLGGRWNHVPGRYNVVTENTVTGCIHAITVNAKVAGTTHSVGNQVYHNNFIDNVNQAPSGQKTSSNQLLVEDYPVGGNFWSNVTTPDQLAGPLQDIPAPNGDGFIDVPYSFDRYPLSEANGWIPKNAPPQALLSADEWAYVGEIVNFDGSASNDVDDNIASYLWAFGDGGEYLESATDAADGAFDGATSYCYSTAADYAVTMTVADSDGAEDSASATVTVVSADGGLDELVSLIASYELSEKVEHPLLVKIDAARTCLVTDDFTCAIDNLQPLINQISGKGFGKKLPEGFVETVVSETERVIDMLNYLLNADANACF